MDFRIFWRSLISRLPLSRSSPNGHDDELERVCHEILATRHGPRRWWQEQGREALPLTLRVNLAPDDEARVNARLVDAAHIVQPEMPSPVPAGSAWTPYADVAAGEPEQLMLPLTNDYELMLQQQGARPLGCQDTANREAPHSASWEARYAAAETAAVEACGRARKLYGDTPHRARAWK